MALLYNMNTEYRYMAKYITKYIFQGNDYEIYLPDTTKLMINDINVYHY